MEIALWTPIRCPPKKQEPWLIPYFLRKDVLFVHLLVHHAHAHLLPEVVHPEFFAVHAVDGVVLAPGCFCGHEAVLLQVVVVDGVGPLHHRHVELNQRQGRTLCLNESKQKQ